jgi:UMF1 family MFS transporter
MEKLPKGHPKLLNAWAMYDWANSVYTLVITSAIFPVFYNALFDKADPYIEFLGIHFKNSALISFVTAAAFLLVAVMSPVLSGIADYAQNLLLFGSHGLHRAQLVQPRQYLLWDFVLFPRADRLLGKPGLL